jgi:PAS domain S-box-containing protein
MSPIIQLPLKPNDERVILSKLIEARRQQVQVSQDFNGNPDTFYSRNARRHALIPPGRKESESGQAFLATISFLLVPARTERCENALFIRVYECASVVKYVLRLMNGLRAGIRRTVVKGNMAGAAGLRTILFLLVLGVGAVWGQEKVLRTAEEVRRLSPEEAGRHIPVHLQGVVTFSDEQLFSRFVQDQTAGIYLREITNTVPPSAGDLVEVEGLTDAGEYAPIVVPMNVRVLGQQPLPPAKQVTLEQLVNGHEDSQFVEVIGTVRSARFEEESQNYLIDLVTGGERFTVYSRQLPVTNTESLVESVLKVRGVCSTLFNRQRQLFGFRLLVPRATDLEIEKPALANPFSVATQPISSLLQFTAQSTTGHRVKVAGTVVYQEPGNALFIQDEKEGLRCQTRQRVPVQVGDRVEVLGFPAKGEYTPVLQDAVYREISSGTAPGPVAIGLDAALSGAHDCRLVYITGKLLEHTQRGREQFIVLEKDGFIFYAYLAREEGGVGFSSAEAGSEVGVTGICLIERGSSWMAGEGWRAKSFRILLRGPGDVVILRSPPWWNVRRVLWMAGILGLLAVAASAWVAILRRRVQKQTEIIRQRLQAEATLKERYVDLFENANDMVFTHDLSGQITSVNMAGERILQRHRDRILSQNIIELMAEDQRGAARGWLDQVVKGADVPTAEWDFEAEGGQRVKLEISSRLVEQNGRTVEVEGIARDITERRRLEREILEISNREQRRIGHDLHDGVCQQLAAITYLADILGDELRDKGATESAEAERIAKLTSEVNSQARSVARGLFPVRLEEHGLTLALEELAASATARYRITCRFVCETDAPVKVESQVELHLYYIVQEALLNAVNHGKATTIIVTLAAVQDRLRLTVQDDGTGFDISSKKRSGMGIRIMRYRAKVIGATLDVQSEPGHGTQITCLFNPATREPLAAAVGNGLAQG